MNLDCDEEEEQHPTIEETLPHFYDFLEYDSTINDDHHSNEVNWDELQVEQNVSSFETFKRPSIVAEKGPSIDFDWSIYFTKDLIFETVEKLVKWTQDYGRMHKQELIVKKHDKSGRTPRMVFACFRHGVYKAKKTHVNEAEKGEKTKKKKAKGTRKCDCPFEVRFTKSYGSMSWWTFHSIKCGTHNHALADYLEGHCVHSRLSKDEVDKFARLTSAGVKPKKALIILKDENPDNVSSLQTLYNVKKKLIKETRDGRTEFQQIYKEGEALGYVMRDRRDYNTGLPIDFFFAPPDSISLAKCFPQVFIMDCTYTTNLYNWPLFEIVGMTSTGQSFPAAYCFMKQETEDHYVWALNCFKELLADDQVPSAVVTDRDQACTKAVEIVFPESDHLYCRWHIMMNIEKKGKQCLPKEEDKKDKKNKKEEKKEGCEEVNEVPLPFGIKRTKDGWEAELKKMWLQCWQEVTWSKSLEEYNANLASLQRDFMEWPQLYEYALTWLEVKEKFVSVWTDKVFHLGNTSSNRVEGTHNTLKQSLERNCRHTFLSMFHQVKNHMVILVSEIKRKFTMSLNLQGLPIKKAFFRNIKGSVSTNCVQILKREFDKVERGKIEEEGCNCALLVTHGLPCACKMAARRLKNEVLNLCDINEFWKKLSIVPRPVEYDDLEMHEEFTLWTAKYRRSSSDQRKYMIRRLREDACGETTWLNTPEVTKRRGRPAGVSQKSQKMDNSTKRDKFAFEREDPIIPVAPPGLYYSQGSQPSRNTLGSALPKMATIPPVCKQIPRKKARSESSMMLYQDHIPTGYEKYVDDLIDVRADGNCGFRAIALGLGLDEDDGWKQVRMDCVTELDRNKEHYAKMWGGEKEVALHRSRINDFKSPNLVSDRYWMIMPETGWVVANYYRKIVVYMVKLEWCTNFLSIVPTLTCPPPLIPSELVNIPLLAVLHTPMHFVQARLKPNAPLPPIANFSLKYRSKEAFGWDDMIKTRTMAFRMEFPDMVPYSIGKQCEEFVLSDDDEEEVTRLTMRF